MYIYFHNDISHFGKALAKQFNLEEVGRGLMPEEGKEIFFSVSTIMTILFI